MLHGAVFFVTCIAVALRDKVQVGCSNLSRNVLGLHQLHKVEFSSTLCNNYMDSFETISSCNSRLQHDFCNLQWISFCDIERQVARKIALCNTNILWAIVASPKKY